MMIALLHAYWAIGGKACLQAAWPRDLTWFFQIKQPLRFGLSFFGIAPLAMVFFIAAMILYPDCFPFFERFYPHFCLIAGVTFILRGVSGPLINILAFSQFFKSQRQQQVVDTFIYWNSYLYSPLAFLMGLLFLLVYVL